MTLFEQDIIKEALKKGTNLFLRLWCAAWDIGIMKNKSPLFFNSSLLDDRPIHYSFQYES